MRTDLTELLNRAQGGDASARDAAFEQIYAELKRIAAAELRRNPGATLNPAERAFLAHVAGVSAWRWGDQHQSG